MIRDYRVFRDFAWSGDLPEFSEKNLIYGWNGSGKSTLSNLFRAIEKRQNLPEGTIEFEIDGRLVKGTQVATNDNLPQIRVFNRDFVTANVGPDFDKTTSHIYFLGEENVEKQKRVAELKEGKEQLLKQLSESTEEERHQESSVEEYASAVARRIKEVMTALGASSYTNYTKRNVKEKWTEFSNLDEIDRLGKALDEGSLDRLREACRATRKEEIGELKNPFSNFHKHWQRVSALLARTVTSAAIERLEGDPKLGVWIKQGFEQFHARNPEICPYCEQTVEKDFFTSLNAHFDDQFKQLSTELAALDADLGDQIGLLTDFEIPHKARLYDQFQTDFEIRSKGLLDDRNCAIANLESLRKSVRAKKEQPFSKVELSTPKLEIDPAHFDAVNEGIRNHNATTRNFVVTVANARKGIEDTYISKSYSRFDTTLKRLDAAKAVTQEKQSRKNSLEQELVLIEGELVSNQIPAKELTNDLRHYLGRDELTFEVEDTGYRIKRHGITASHLSEGERTAVAFLFFLKSLRDKGFDIEKGIVVIDDPVSSLDSNSLFSAFGYLKERTKDSGQLFVLTHSFALFRQIKNWFNSVNKEDRKRKPATSYSLVMGLHNGRRTSELKQLDLLLEKFESEYYFLFSEVYKAATDEVPETDLAYYYGLPNMARRLVETFMAHHYPDISGQLYKAFQRAEFAPEKKERILRFVHTFSHLGRISEPEHEASILAETKMVLCDLLEMLEELDANNFDGMIKLLSNSNTEN